jgi:Mg2+/Co2+ transporter CorB
VVKKGLKFAFLTLLCYLMQSTLSQYLSLWDVAPNIALAIIAVVSVAMGRKYTFVMSVTVGYLLELMLPTLPYINVILYPVCAMLGSLAFSDKSELKLEEARTLGRRAGNLPPHLRTMLCALVSITVFETVNLMYVYLSGIQLDNGHWSRAVISVVYTTALAGALQFPIRWWLGVYKLKKAR